MEKKNSDGEAFPRPRRVERTFPSPHARGSPHLHRVTWHSLFAQATGIDAVVLHSPRIFEKAGIKSDNYLLLRDGCGWVRENRFHFGRHFFVGPGRVARTLAFDSGPEPHSGGPFADHADVGGWAQHRKTHYVATFWIGSGPVTWVYRSEIFPLSVNRVTSGVISSTFLSLYKAITIGGAFFLFAGVAVPAWIFHYTLLPEISGKTLEEIEKSFGNFFGKPKEEAEGVVDYNGEIQLKTCDQTLTSVD
ncbi:Polyol transporter 5 [Glycine soja]